MRIAQIILPGASEYERKNQRADQAALASRCEVVVTGVDEVRDSGAHLAHVYAGHGVPPRMFAGFPLPYVSSVALRQPRWTLRKATPPAALIAPFATDGYVVVPEAVEDHWYDAVPSREAREAKIIGSIARPEDRNQIEQTLHRLRRIREDLDWHLFDAPPTPAALSGVDLWVDPTFVEENYDGFVAEALVLGLPVVATRTAINAHRLEQGRTGLLVPPRDPNEMTHAILSLLFKQEVRESKNSAARQTVAKFRARARARILLRLYEAVIA